MKTLYISHPFTGNEKDNAIDAERIRKDLQERYSGICFINPLSMFGGAETDYCLSLALALEVLSRCDGIIMYPGWQESGGCRAEKAFAMREGMEIYNLESFLQDEC